LTSSISSLIACSTRTTLIFSSVSASTFLTFRWSVFLLGMGRPTSKRQNAR
jgi:hypothetical protein